MKLVLILISFLPIVAHTQQKPKFSIGIEAGVTPKAKNIMDSGYVDLPQKRNQVLALNVLMEKSFGHSTRFEWGIGLRNAIYFTQDFWTNTDKDTNTGYLIPGPHFANLRNGFGDFFTLKSSLQFTIKYYFFKGKMTNYSIAYIPELSMYWPNLEGPRSMKVFNQTGVIYTIYEGYGDFYKGRNGYSTVDFKIENTFSLGSKIKISKRTIIGFDLNYHIGTKKLERTDLVFYPDVPQYTAKMHYSKSNNYLSLGIRYFLDKGQDIHSVEK